MPVDKNLRDWTERNQGVMPQSDPRSRNASTALDIASPTESRHGTNGAVDDADAPLGSISTGLLKSR
jgi:hypothetical protein